jgi:GAF domain-containing protein
MTSIARPVLDAIVNAAVDVTAASVGWLLMFDESAGEDGEQLVVVAAAGGDAAQSRVGRRVALSGVSGLVISSEQPAAIDTPPTDTSNVGAGGLDGNPAGVLAAPCGDDDVVGVLEVARVEGSGPFTVDDIEEISLLARIAGAALEELDDGSVAVPTPTELARDLERLAAAEPARYAAIARLVAAAIGHDG